MLKNDKLGIEIAENENEELWSKTVETTKQRIKDLETSLKIEKVVLRAFENKLLQAGR